MAQALNILYQDDYMLVVDKPAGLVMEPTQTQHTLTLAEILQQDYHIALDRGGIVHRLDKDTSGVLLVAKTQDALEQLQSQFKNRTIQKTYQALVHGFIENPGTINAAVARNPQNREKFMALSVDEQLDSSKEAVTDYQPIQKYLLQPQTITQLFVGFNKIQLRKLTNLNYNRYTLVNCFPKTGRTHQIRIHLKHIGFPIVADDKYGGRKVQRLDKRWCPRHFLHAFRLEFTHPITKKPMDIKSPLPGELQQALNWLSKIL